MEALEKQFQSRRLSSSCRAWWRWTRAQGRPNHGSAAQSAPGVDVATGELCADAGGRRGACSRTATRRTAGRGTPAVGRGRRRAVLAEAHADRQRQSGVRGRLDGAAHGHHGGLHATRVADLAAGRVGQPGEDRHFAGSDDAPSPGLSRSPPTPSCRLRPRAPNRFSIASRASASFSWWCYWWWSTSTRCYPYSALVPSWPGLLFIALGYAVGWALGGPAADTRPVLGLGTAQRNIAAALVVGGQSFSDPSVVVIVVVAAIVSLLILLPMSRLLARKAQPLVQAEGHWLLDQEAQAWHRTVSSRVVGDPRPGQSAVGCEVRWRPAAHARRNLRSPVRPQHSAVARTWSMAHYCPPWVLSRTLNSRAQRSLVLP